VLPVTDAAALTAAAVAATVAGGGPGPLPCALFAFGMLAILGAGGQHRLRICLRVTDQAGRLLTAAALPLPALLWWQQAAARQLGWLALWSAGLVLLARALVCAVLRAAHRRGLFTERALVIGSGTFGAYLAELMRQHPETGLRPVGFLDDTPRPDLTLPTLGTVAELPELVHRLAIRRVVIAYSTCRDEDLVSLLRASRPLPADVCVVPRLYEIGAAVPRACMDEIWGIPLIPLRHFGTLPAGAATKRAFDLAVALPLLVLTAPLMLLFAAVVRLRTGGPALFHQVRVTGEGRVAPITKLRTVTDQPDSDTRWTVEGVQSTPLGRWLRRTHADELPQLASVVRGDLSLVGPRPERPYFADQFGRDIPRYADRTRMQAGATGWAQVHGLNGDTSIFERARFDNYYIEYWSLWLDLAVLARTVVAAARGAGRDEP
jgi:exopolysaccharide biosynthesis polyprenyl glycosylphosphotransferase